MIYKYFFLLALMMSASGLVSGQTLDWSFLAPEDGCSSVVTDCSSGQQCYALNYTPANTGTVTSYTLGFLANCIGDNTASLRGESCTMTDNTDIQSACVAANLLQILPSGNSGTLPVVVNEPVKLHEVCVTLPAGTSMTFNEDASLALTVSIDLPGGGAVTDVLNYTAFTATSTDCGATLPVSWQTFTVQRLGKEAQLSWETANEIDHDYFRVEWGSDGSNFVPLATVREADNRTGSGGDYSYVHTTPAEGVNYYRIRQVDYSGASSYSPIRSVTFNREDRSSGFSFFPNPAQTSVQLKFMGSTSVKELSIYTLAGKVVQRTMLGVSNQTVNISVADLPKGIYLVRAGNETKRLIKQ